MTKTNQPAEQIEAMECQCGHDRNRHEMEPPCPCYECDCIGYFVALEQPARDGEAREENMNEDYDPTNDLIEIDRMTLEGGSVIRQQAEHNTEALKRLGILDDNGEMKQQPNDSMEDRARELLPCPFCGGVAELRQTPDDRLFWVECFMCEIGTKYYDNQNGAIKTWNTRAELSRLRRQELAEKEREIERLTSCLKTVCLLSAEEFDDTPNVLAFEALAEGAKQ